MHKQFDLKGSTVDRQASDKEKVIMITVLSLCMKLLEYYTFPSLTSMMTVCHARTLT